MYCLIVTGKKQTQVSLHKTAGDVVAAIEREIPRDGELVTLTADDEADESDDGTYIAARCWVFEVELDGSPGTAVDPRDLVVTN